MKKLPYIPSSYNFSAYRCKQQKKAFFKMMKLKKEMIKPDPLRHIMVIPPHMVFIYYFMSYMYGVMTNHYAVRNLLLKKTCEECNYYVEAISHTNEGEDAFIFEKPYKVIK